MKKSKLLVLAAMTALTLVGCGGGDSGAKGGQLPSGGKEVDVSTETGKATLKERLDNTVKAYGELKLESIGVKSVTSGINANVKVNADMSETSGVKANAELAIKGVGATTEGKLSKSSEGNLDASILVNGTSGSLSLGGSLTTPLPQEKEGDPVKYETTKFNASLNVGSIEVGAYLSGDKVYADLSNGGIDKFVTGVDTFANDLLGDLSKNTTLGALLPYLLSSADLPFIKVSEEGAASFAFKSAFDAAFEGFGGRKIYVQAGSAIQFPSFAVEGEVEGLDEAVETIAALVEQKIGLSFKTYDKGGFGFQLSLTKDSIKTLAATYAGESFDASVIDKYLDKFSLNADVYFNDKCLLESAGLAIDASAKFNPTKEEMTEMELPFDSFSVTGSVQGKEEIKVSYNDAKVTFPSFADYKEVVLEDQSEPIFIEE